MSTSPDNRGADFPAEMSLIDAIGMLHGSDGPSELNQLRKLVGGFDPKFNDIPSIMASLEERNLLCELARLHDGFALEACDQGQLGEALEHSRLSAELRERYDEDLCDYSPWGRFDARERVDREHAIHERVDALIQRQIRFL